MIRYNAGRISPQMRKASPSPIIMLSPGQGKVGAMFSAIAKWVQERGRTVSSTSGSRNASICSWKTPFGTPRTKPKNAMGASSRREMA